METLKKQRGTQNINGQLKKSPSRRRNSDRRAKITVRLYSGRFPLCIFEFSGLNNVGIECKKLNFEHVAEDLVL